MKNRVKAIITALTSAVICAAPASAVFTGTAMIPAITAEAASNEATLLFNNIVELNEVYYRLNGSAKTASVVGGYEGGPEEFAVPATIRYSGKDYKVTEVSADAFCNTEVKKVDLSACIYLISIGARAFKGSSLNEIKLNTKLQYIRESAFQDTQLTSVRIPGGVREISNRAFRYCNNLSNVFFQSASAAGINVNTPLVLRTESFGSDVRLTHVDTYRKVYQMERYAFMGTHNITWYEGAGRNSFITQYRNNH